MGPEKVVETGNRGLEEAGAGLPAVWRRTTQRLAPVQHRPTPPGVYDIYPSFPLGPGCIGVGHAALAERLARHRRVILDGFGGVFWDYLRMQLEAEFQRMGLRVAWRNVGDALRPPDEIQRMVAPFLGGEDPLFGARFTGTLAEFFDPGRLALLDPDEAADLSILYGCGAALAGWDGSLVYVDVPKNEVQYRARAGVVANLGARPTDAKTFYKRAYFVDWPALNEHLAALSPRVGLFVDGQRPDEPVFASGRHVRAALSAMSANYFRVRPWFEPGPWGGQWIKEHIPELPQDAPNYAWSFELISPENGLMLESDGRLLELSFDWLMVHASENVLGDWAAMMGRLFPIRFDFLDTWDGGNLSVQCHPRPDYIRRHFGEIITQDECYYILDCQPRAEVFLGFREGMEPEAFRAELEASLLEGREVDVRRFVHTVPARKHDLLLIPQGTIHGSGRGNLVLEISNTPYIFTFKMYDWLRRDLEGQLRPLNIARAFENLYFERRGRRVAEELVSRPRVVGEGEGWRVVHLPTHRQHLYDVRRYEFSGSVEGETAGSPHVMNVVEGRSVLLETSSGMAQRFNYAETFVVPAAAGRYRLIAEGGAARVVAAHMK